MDLLANAGIMALASMFVGILPLALAVVYAIWPSEQRLMLMRPLSLATVFSSVAGVALGAINELMYVVRAGEAATNRIIMVGTAESLVTLFFGFGCLTVAWLCVTIGMARRPWETRAQGPEAG